MTRLLTVDEDVFWRPILVGIGGDSGSGMTTLASRGLRARPQAQGGSDLESC